MTNLPLLILCAGFGKRMLNLTINSPKPLLVIDNITLLKNTIYFFKMVGFKEFLINTHYLHHKFFECNYADGGIPLDKYFGTFHDGSEEAQERMMQRYKERMKKMRNVV